MTEPMAGYTEAEGYAASLRQQARLIAEGSIELDAEELEAAADFIERLTRYDAVSREALEARCQEFLLNDNKKARAVVIAAREFADFVLKEIALVPSEAGRDLVNLGRVFAVTNLTEHQDVAFFLERWGACENVDEKRQLIRSFRNQIINVAAGEMSALSDPGTVAVASAQLLSPGHAGNDPEMPADGYSHSSTLRETP